MAQVRAADRAGPGDFEFAAALAATFADERLAAPCSRVLAVVAVCAVLQPRWFRGWYRLSLRLGFYSSQFIGRCVLVLFFIFIITPLGWVLRLAGKDPLQLKRPRNATTYWQPSKDCSPLDRLF